MKLNMIRDDALFCILYSHQEVYLDCFIDKVHVTRPLIFIGQFIDFKFKISPSSLLLFASLLRQYNKYVIVLNAN